MVNLTNEEHQRLCEQAKRAEAAEARAADDEVRAKSWHDSAMTLADQRDAAYKRNAELEAERDELARKLEQAQRETERLTRFLQTIVNLGDVKNHAAFDGERHREMRHCANQALRTKNESYEP